MRIISRALPLLAFPCAVAVACNFTSGNSNSDAGPTASVDGGAPIAAGGTGAFGIVTIGGKQKMYLPQREDPTGKVYIAVVNVSAQGNGVNGAPALVTKIELPAPDAGTSIYGAPYATATGGDSSMVIAVSTDFPMIWFIDPNTDTLVKTLTLDSSYGKSNFSGGGGYVTGVAIDSAHHRAILSVWNGFALVDLGTQTITSVIEAPPTENFGFDSVHQRILAPFYDCSSSSVIDPDSGVSTPPSSCSSPKAPDGGGVISAGLSVIDLTDNTVYTYEAPPPVADATPDYRTSALEPVGTEPDSAAADPTTQVVVVPSEGGSFQNIIDFSQAVFDKASKTVTAPAKIVPNISMTGVAVESNVHLAFWEEEHSRDVGVADLNAANAGSKSWVHGMMPALPVALPDDAGTVSGLSDGPSGPSFSNLGDPHGIAVTTALTSGGPVGFVVNSALDWVARVDLAQMLSNQSSDASVVLTEAQMAPYVTYLDATH